MRLAAVVLLLLVAPCLALRCHLFHDFYEGGKRMRILPDICSSEKYCVSAIYKDSNWKKKNGISQGCDRVDCAEAESGMNTAWKHRGENMTCRSHKDFGERGEICCCKSDLCNTAASHLVLFIPLLIWLVV